MLVRAAMILLLSWVLAGCGGEGKSRREAPGNPPDVVQPALPDYWPTSAWQVAAPELQGFVPGALDTLAAQAEATLPALTSLMIVRHGHVVHESYHTPAGVTPAVGPDTKHNLWSVTKSISSLTVGAAWQDGDIAAPDLELTTNDFFADIMADYDPADGRRSIRFRDVLEMRSGLDWNEAEDLALFTVMHVFVRDPTCTDNLTLTVCSLLRRPLAHALQRPVGWPAAGVAGVAGAVHHAPG